MCAFQRKLKLQQQQLENNNFANFPLLDEIVSNRSAINDEVSCNELQGFCQYLLRIFRNLKDHLKTTFLNKCNILHGYVSHFLMILQQQI